MSNYNLGFDNLIKLDEKLVDNYILDLHNTLNNSDNYDGVYWSIPLIIKNLDSGHFDIELIDEYDLFIFGVLIDTLDETTKNILMSE